MQLEHSFSVPVGIDEAWPILIDIERIGPCMPGAAIDSVDGDEFTGTVKVKLGPINLTYKGKAAFLEKDEAARRAVIDARGRDARGNGTAAAKITATLHDAGDSTTVKVITDLDITGKPAQFGRGVMVDVGNKLLGQFADSLAKTIRGGEAAAPEVAVAPAPAPAGAAASTVEPASVGETAPPPVAATQTETPESPIAETTVPEPSAPTPTGQTGAGEAPAADAPAAEAPAPPTMPTEAAASATASPATPKPATAPPPATTIDELAERADGAVKTAPPKSYDEVEPIDLLHHAGPAVAKRLAPVAVALVVVLIAIGRRRRSG